MASARSGAVGALRARATDSVLVERERSDCCDTSRVGLGVRLDHGLVGPSWLSVTSLAVVLALVACGGGSDSPANVRGVDYPGLDDAKAERAYDDGYEFCYGPNEVRPEESGGAVEPDYRAVYQAGCDDANEDIEACVPPIYFDGVSAFYCDDGNGRYLKDVSEP
jgi:hypothetical protein